ncbi:MAG: hypothetical protein NXI04_01095 [Planctomycetaceae bacterium]|nr:hypothetical protein [Planctomycetaceae bacterium]
MNWSHGRLPGALAAVTISAVLLVGVSGDERARDDQSTAYLSGVKLLDALQQRRGITFDGSPLRKVVSELQRSCRVPIVIDRRIDPDQRVTIRTDYVTCRTTLVTLAGEVGARASFGHGYVYIGPPASAVLLQTRVALLEERVRQLRKEMDPELYRGLTTRFDGSWGRLSAPRTLLQERAGQLGLLVSEPDKVPHDLWSAARLPSMTFADFATLILTQFDLQLSVAASGELQFAPQTMDVAVERKHRVPLRDKSDVLRRWRQALPDLQITWRGSTATLSTTVENHERLKRLAKGQQVPSDEPGGLLSRTMEFRTPPRTRLGTVLASLRISVPIRLIGKTEADLQQELNQFVEINEVGTPSAEFFPKALAGLNGKVEVTDQEVTVTFD